MVGIYSYSLALTLQEKKEYKSEFCDLNSSGLFENLKIWIEINYPESKEIPNRKIFPTIMNSIGVKNTRDFYQAPKRIKMANSVDCLLIGLLKKPIFLLEYLPDEFIITTSYLISSEGQVLRPIQIKSPANETLLIRINRVQVEKAIKDAN
jgi:hypothetical protein